jgi:hypothetical protein
MTAKIIMGTVPLPEPANISTVMTGSHVYVNNSHGLQQVLISGGTISSITISSAFATSQYTVTSNVITLRASDILTINNTVAPTITIMQLT